MPSLDNKVKCYKNDLDWPLASIVHYNNISGTTFVTSRLLSLDDTGLPEWAVLLKERFCSWRSKFLLLSAGPKGFKNKSDRLAVFESLPISLKCLLCLAKDFDFSSVSSGYNAQSMLILGDFIRPSD